MRPIPFARFKVEVLALYGSPHRAPSTRRKLEQVLKLVEDLGVKTTADLTPGLVARFIEARPPGQSPQTLAALLRVVRSMSNQAVVMGYLRVSPFALRRVSQWVGRIGPPKPKLWFKAEQVRRVLDLMARDVSETQGWAQWRSRRLLALTSTVALAGLRASEAQYLHVVDLDLKARSIALVDRGRSGGLRLKTEASAGAVPTPEALISILRDWLDHRMDHPVDFPVPVDCPWLFPNLNRRGAWRDGAPGMKPVQRLQQVAARAGVPGMTFKALRATWATRGENLGYSALTIQRVLRHSNPTTQLWYRGLDVEAVTRTVADFNY